MFCTLEKCRINENAKRSDSNSRAKRNCMTASEEKNAFGMIKAIIFDFDGTLAVLNIDFSLMRERIFDLMRGYGIQDETIQEKYLLEITDEAYQLLWEKDPTGAEAFPDDKINLGNIFQNFLAITFHQATGHHEPLGGACLLVLGHFEDRVDGLAFGRVDEAARIDDENVGIFRQRGQFEALARQDAEHDFAVHEILGTAQTDHSHFGHIF